MSGSKHFLRLCSWIVLVTFLIAQVPPATTVLAQNDTSSELFYVAYDNAENRVIAVEIRDAVRHSNGSVSGRFCIRVEKMIAYGLEFDQEHTTADWLEEMDLLPTFKTDEPIEVGIITFKPGGSLIITADKFGDSWQDNGLMVVTDLALLGIYLVGAKPPTNDLSFISAVFESLSVIPGFEIVEIGALITDIMNEEDWDTIALDFADLAQIDEIAAAAANLANKIMRKDILSGKGLKQLFNAFEWARSFGNVLKALKDLVTAPRHAEIRITLAPIILERSEFPVLLPGEQAEVYFVLQNIGTETWQPGDYWLEHIGGHTLGLSPQQVLPYSVPPGETVRWDLIVTAPPFSGVYQSEWQMRCRGQPYGEPLFFAVSVVPEGEVDLAEIIRRMIDEARQEAGDKFDEIWEDLKQLIEEKIREAEDAAWQAFLEWLNRVIEDALQQTCNSCFGPAALIWVAGIGLMWRRSREHS